MAEGGSKKGRVSLNLTLTLSNVIFLSVYGVCVCVFVSFAQLHDFYLYIFVFHLEDLVLLHLISICVTSETE